MVSCAHAILNNTSRKFHEAQTAANLGKIETAIEILESIRVKSLLPGKGPRKGFENLLAETEEALATVQQAKADLDSAHKEAIELMKEAEELLGKGEKQDAKVVFESALDRYLKAFRASPFSETWLGVIHDSADASGPTWSACHDSMSIDGHLLFCEESSVGSAVTDQVADTGNLVCEIRIKKMQAREEGEDSDIFFGVMRDNIDLDAFWFEEEFEDLIWFYSDDGDLCTGEETLDDVEASWGYKEGDSVRLELQFTNGDDKGVLKFYKNGALIPQHFTGIEGPVIPAVLFSDCQEGDCIELVDLQYDPGDDPAQEAVEDVTDSLHELMPVFSVMDAFASFCRATVQYINFQDDESKATISQTKNSLSRAITKLYRVHDMKRIKECNSRKMDLVTALKNDFIKRAKTSIDEAEALVEQGKLTQSFKIFDIAIVLMQKIDETEMLKMAKKARQAAVARRDLSFRNADRMMKQVRTRIKSEVIAVLLEGFEDSVKMAAEAAALFEEAGEPGKSKDALVTRAICEDLEQASQLANSGNKSFDNARISGVKHHFQKANDEYSMAANLCSKVGNKVYAEEMKILAYRSMEAFKAVEVADAESPTADGIDEIDKAVEDYADAMDGKPDEEEADAGGSVEPCLTGVISRRIMAPPKLFSVYVSSSIAENEPERLCLAREVAQMVREAVNSFGYEFEFIDPFFSLWNAQELAHDFHFRDKANAVLKQCQAESAGIDFLYLLGQGDNGTSYPGKIDFDTFNSIVKCIPDRGELGKLRRIIIDWYKLDTNSNPRKYVMLEAKKKIQNLASSDPKKKEIGRQEWERQYAQIQKGFYEACKIQIASLKMQKIRIGILGKLGGVDSYNMKRKCYELFCEIDVDGSGQIDQDELQTAFEQLNIELTAEETRSFMDEFDEDQSGEIGFDEFLLIVEKLLLDAKDHEKEDLIKDVDHVKYFMQSLMYQDACDGILDRSRDIALERSAAVLWGFDPMQMGQELKYFEDGDEFEVMDSVAALRTSGLAEKGGKEALDKHEQARPEWLLHTKSWQLKELVFKKLVDMEEYVEDNPPDDIITPETPLSREGGVSGASMPDVDVLPLESSPPREQAGRLPPPPTGADTRAQTSDIRGDAANDRFGGRRIDPEVWDVLSLRKSTFLKVLSDWEFMRVVSRSKRATFVASKDKPFAIVQPGETENWGEEGISKTHDTIRRMHDKIGRLAESERRERNAITKAKLQDDIRSCEETIQCLQADVDRTMYVVLKGELEVLLVQEPESAPSSRAGTRGSGRPKSIASVEPVLTKLATLAKGDAFGDLTLVLGMHRDTKVCAVTPVDLAVIRYDMVESLLVRNQDIEERIKLLVQSLKPKSPDLQTHFLSRAAPPDQKSYKQINSAMTALKSPLLKVLTAREIQNLSKLVSITTLPAGVVLCKQDDGPDTGWGPYGDSAFLLVQGELGITITFEDGNDARKPSEVARVMTVGESVGDMNVVAGAARTSTVVTVTDCLLVEITRHQLATIVHRDIREDLISFLTTSKTVENVEARVLTQRSRHAMRQRLSTFLKQLTDIEIDFLASVAVVRVVDKETLVVHQGDWGNSCFVVLRGQLRVLVAFAEGEQLREVGRLKGGDVFGEMTLLMDYPRSSTIEVISKQAMLAEITRDAIDAMLKSRPEIIEMMDMMLHGDEGLDDIMRARTPIGGRAATPDGVLATGLKTSISVVSFPWKAEEKGMHAELRGPKYRKAFAQKVTNAILERIEPTLEKDSHLLDDKTLPILLECSFHLGIAAIKTEVFSGRKEELRRLVEYIQGDYQQRMGLKNQPTVVMGEAGVGKTSLLAMAGIRAKARNPGAIIIHRYMGRSQQTLNARKMMKSVLTQMMTTFGMKIPELPYDLTELGKILLSLLEKATKQEMISLILDAVDDLETPEGFMPSFEWLPKRLPKYSSIILSLKVSSVRHVNVLNNMFTGEVYFNIYALRPLDATSVLEGYLDKRGKPGFHNKHFETIRIASLESAGLEGVPLNCSPLFLNLCMDVSEAWISFESAPILPANIPDLVKMVFVQLEQDHGEVMTERALTYLYTSRDGLTWQELYDLLSCDDDVLDEVYKPLIPAFRRIPSFKAKLLSNSLSKLVFEGRNEQVLTHSFCYSFYREAVFDKYGLQNTVRRCSFHRAMALYFSGEWFDGKEIWNMQTHQWKPSAEDDTKYHRGINPQLTFLEGHSRLFFHRRKQSANLRKIRELPYHICWYSGRTPGSIDPISRALAQRPPSSWNARSENDRNAQIMFLKHFCCLDVVEAASLSGYAHELHDDMLLAKKIFPYSELVRQFHKLVHEAVETLAGSGHLTFQCALNAAGNGQGLINEIAQNMLKIYYEENDPDRIPQVWFVHTNKDEVMDSLYVQYLGHWGGVFFVTTSNKDDIVMTCGADCSIRLYDATSGNEIKRIEGGHAETILKVNFSPTNKQLVSCSADMTAIIWDLVTGDQVTRLEGHQGEVLDAIFLTSDVLMTASNDATLRTWKGETGQVIKVFNGHRSAVTCCLSLAKGVQAISSSFDKTIRIWEVSSGMELLMLAGHEGVIYDIDLSRDQRRLLSCASDQMVKVWDLDAGLAIETLHLHEYAVTACAFDPTGNWIVTGGIDKTVRILELSSNADAVIVGEHKAAVCSIKFSNDGDFILSAGADGVVSKWEWAVAHQVATDSTPDHTAAICHVEFSSTGKHCASLSSDGVAILRVLDWQCSTLVAHQLTDAKNPSSACKFAPNGLTIATLHAFGCLLWDTKAGNMVGRFGQVFNLYSLNFPEAVEYLVAPPLSPLVKPDDHVGEDEEMQNEEQDPNIFNLAQMEVLQDLANDRHKKRFRADYIAIAKNIDQLEGGRGVEWRDVRDELDRLIKEGTKREAEAQQKKREKELVAEQARRKQEAEEMIREHKETKQKAAIDAEMAIDRLMSDFRFCESCGVPWVVGSKSCSSCSSAWPGTDFVTSENTFGNCDKCDSSFISDGKYCHRCGSVRERDAEEIAHELGIDIEENTDEGKHEAFDKSKNAPDASTAAPSFPIRPRSKASGPQGLLEDGVALWFDALSRIVSGVDTELALVKQLVQADKDTLAQGKLNAEISVFGRELTAQERDAFDWNVSALSTSKHERTTEQNLLIEPEKTIDGANNVESSEQREAANLNGKKTAENGTSPSARKAKLKKQKALVRVLLQARVERQVFGRDLTKEERDDEWQGANRKKLEKTLAQAETATRNELHDNLRDFLERESYGELPKSVQDASTEECTSEPVRQSPVVQDSTTKESDGLVNSGVALWMRGIAKILTGGEEEMEVMKQVLKDEECKLALMKANAEVAVLGRELTEQEREAAWADGPAENLSFLRQDAEVEVLRHKLDEKEHYQAWSSGPMKNKLVKSFSRKRQDLKRKLEHNLGRIQGANVLLHTAASRPSSGQKSVPVEGCKHAATGIFTPDAEARGASSPPTTTSTLPEKEAHARLNYLYAEPFVGPASQASQKSQDLIKNQQEFAATTSRLHQELESSAHLQEQAPQHASEASATGEDYPAVTLSGVKFGSDDIVNDLEDHSPSSSLSDPTEMMENGDLEATEAGAEVLRISTAPDTADTADSADTANVDIDEPDDQALQERINLYTDVDVEVIEERPGTSASIQLRPRTRGSKDISRPQTGVGGDRPQTSRTNLSVSSRQAQSRPTTGGENLADQSSVDAEKPFHSWEDEHLDADMITMTVTHESPLWSLDSLLRFLQKVDPKKLEDQAKKDAEAQRRAKLKMEARKRKSAVGAEKEQKEVYDVDKPEKDVDIEIVQKILFILDQLEATTNPKSEMYGKSTEVLTNIGNERMSRRNIAFPARGIPSLNFLVVETITPYLSHPIKEVRLEAIACLAKIARPGDEKASHLLGEIAGDKDEDIKAAVVIAMSNLSHSDDGDDEEDMKDPLVRKMLTVTVKGASDLAAADASGTSDPFATIVIQAVDADIDEIKTMRSQNFGSAKELMKSSFEETMEDAPAMVELALKRMLLKRALVLEMTTSWDHKEMLKDCNFVTVEKNKILFVQGDSIDSLFVVISGAARVMIKFDVHAKPKDEQEREETQPRKKVPVVGMHDLGQQVALLDKGDTIGEMSLILQEDQTASVVAAEDCHFLEITRQALNGLKKRKPSVVTDLKLRALKQRGLLSDDGSKRSAQDMRKTDVKTKTLNPVWQETFCFYNIDVQSSLVVSIFDHDIIGSHDFLGRVLIEIQSLPINQDLETWFPLEARSDEDEVSGMLCLHLRLQTDKRARIQMQDGETFVPEVNGNMVQLMRDSSSNAAEPRPETVFRLGSKIGAFHVSPADPRNLVVGDQDGRVSLLRVQDILNYRWECEMLERQAQEDRQAYSVQMLSIPDV